MRTFDLARKDWIQIFRDKRSLLFLLVMPIIFTFFFGFVMGKPDRGEEDSRYPVAIVNRDSESAASQAFIELLATSDTVRPVEWKAEEMDRLEEKVRAGELAAAIILPSGYQVEWMAYAASGGGASEMPRLEMVLDSQSQAGITANRAVKTMLTRLAADVHMASFTARQYAETVGFADHAARQAFEDESLGRLAKAWQESPAAVEMTGPQVDMKEAGEEPAVNPYTQYSPGMMVMFAVFGLTQVAMVLVFERRNGALRRLISTPLRRPELIGGHLLAMFSVIFAQQFLLAAFGQVVLGVNYLGEPAASLSVMAALSLVVASIGLLIGALARTEEQVTLWSLIAMFLMSALGGTWFSLEFAGKTFAAIGHLMPTAWAMDGFQNIVQRGLGAESILMPVGILLTYALVFFGIAVWQFKFE
jgi:ABC-2 type transport system permease protein